MPDDVVAQKFNDFWEKWDSFGQILELNQSGDAGPFVTGNTLTFADFATVSLFFLLQKIEGEDGEL